MRTIERLTWLECERCGRITRHRRHVAIRPHDPRNLAAEFRAWLHDKLAPWKCLEHGRYGTPSARPRLPLPFSIIHPSEFTGGQRP